MFLFVRCINISVIDPQHSIPIVFIPSVSLVSTLQFAAFTRVTITMKPQLCIFFLILFSQIFVRALAERGNDDVSSSSSEIEAKNQVIEELKKQNEDMKVMMTDVRLKFLRQEETLTN